MARGDNQKLKILYIMRLLTERSDEQHPISMSEIIKYLEDNDISAERKSIYSDLEALRDFGLDIVQQRGPGGGYYVASRSFELPELKLLVDSVQSSKFITERKTISLIKKIEGLASIYEAKLLDRQVFVRGRIKTMNESIYYNVDEIHGGIVAGCKIRFKYFEYNVLKQRVFRHEGRVYEVSPYALMWDNENYYMIAYDSEAECIKHYRVDKMSSISVTDEKREGAQCFKEHDLARYSKSLFGMFTGETRLLRLRFENRLVGAVIDRFGKDVPIVPEGEEHFIAAVEAAVSPNFFGWLCGFGSGVKILAPDDVAEDFARTVKEIAEMYG